MLINPMAFNPQAAFDRMHAYLFATWARVVYRVTDPIYTDPIKEVMGATEFTVLEEDTFHGTGAIVLKAHVARGPWGSASMLRGTTSVLPQLLGEILNSGQVTHADIWEGQVTDYFALSAIVTGPKLAPHVVHPWLSAGHSLGGAVAALVSQGGAELALPSAQLVFTIGAPRDGNYNYSQSRFDATRLRLENHGDPVPLVPKSLFQAPWNDQIFLPGGNINIGGIYNPWGVHHHLWEDGTITLPPPAIRSDLDEAQEYARSAFTTQVIFNFHYPQSYSLRLRRGIPRRFPVVNHDPDFPGLFELDTLNLLLNGEDAVEWSIDGLTFRRAAVSQGGLEPPDLVSFVCE